MKILCLPVLVLLGACTTMGAAAPVTLDVQELARGQHARGDDRHFELVTTSDRLAEIWHRVGGAPPAVDFDTRSVIVVFMGQQSSGGHTVTVASAERRGDVLHVTVRLRVPGVGCMTTQALTSPFQVVSIPAGSAHAEFTTETVAVACQ